jgi:hypothetical protein
LRIAALRTSNLALLAAVCIENERMLWDTETENSGNQMWDVETPNTDKYYFYFLYRNRSLT